MKYLFTILLFVSFAAQARKVSVSTSAGGYNMPVNFQAANSIVAGDTIALSGSVTADVTFKNITVAVGSYVYYDLSGCTFTRGSESIHLDSLNGAYVFGFYFPHGMTGYVFLPNPASSNWVIDWGYRYMRNFTGFLVNTDNSNTRVYNGADPTTYRVNGTIKNAYVDSLSGGFIFMGADSCDSGHNVWFGFSILNCVVLNCIGGGETIHIPNAYTTNTNKVRICNNRFYNTDSCNCNHSSDIYIQGSGTVDSNYFFNNRGDCVRFFCMGLYDPTNNIITDSNAYIIDNIDVNSRAYPFAEPNFQPVDTGGKFRGYLHSYYTVQYNTVGNTTQRPDIGLGFAGVCAGFAPNIKCNYNVGFHISRDVSYSTPTSNYIYQNGAGFTTGIDTTNNIYDSSRIGAYLQLTDTISADVKNTSPVLGKGNTIPQMITDWGGRGRPTHPAYGAREPVFYQNKVIVNYKKAKSG